MPDPSPDALERVRSICQSLPEVHEQDAWTGVRWRVRHHTFAHLLVVDDGKPQSHARAVGHDGPVTLLTFRAPASEVDAFAAMGAPYFYGGWGSRHGRPGDRPRHRLGRGRGAARRELPRHGTATARRPPRRRRRCLTAAPATVWP